MIEKQPTTPVVLSIAGSDAFGGAGIQADIKTITTCGAYAATAITCVTAQSSHGVFDIHPVPPSTVRSQIDHIINDLPIHAVKLGMLYDLEIIEVVAKALEQIDCPIVIDPVMVASSSDSLIAENAFHAMEELLFPKATLLTPNIPEAKEMGHKHNDDQDWQEVAIDIGKKYGCAVLLKGGHTTSSILTDILYDPKEEEIFCIKNPRIDTANTHGTGCTLSSAIATYLAKGYTLKNAVINGINYVHKLLDKSKEVKMHSKNGPMYHYLQK
ncbi:bifunctional hydroxymethylpyrimidine kinase/phosphomethylpyrimidine kinase [Halosquirtibacter xylanolyticus]|uniref:bifunctional hydroxymethylpyrimidine kinase/phosphomethylpyrimidine kinase n=1 Tax=Halosquirtibacter xylanolyticus TaxID=3374599 RepID=UPI003748EA1A|nr:bifunctional hydroxymethylpyrimidine kinase/phosphomethylpyrimidine kinase [Prolixibacteraceae bacterium]